MSGKRSRLRWPHPCDSSLGWGFRFASTPDEGRFERTRFRNRAALRGAEPCVILHRSLLDVGTKDPARQALTAEVPTYLIDPEVAVPKRLRTRDAKSR
jgi:hypothetical protein